MSTGFGRLILVKTGLLAVLVGLGARNRYRSIPDVEGSPRPLLRLGRAELGLAAVVLVATAVLQGLAPPSTVAASPQPKPLVVTGHDFATTVKVRLSISPGTTGFNRFDLAADDYDTGRPVVADPVTLTFSQPDRPDLGHSTLTLHRVADGTYQASGPNLSITGTWRVAVLVQQPSDAAQIDLSVTPRTPPEHVTVNHSPGVPDLYTISLATGGSVQVYLDPGHPGIQRVPRHLRRRRRPGDPHPLGHRRGQWSIRGHSTTQRAQARHHRPLRGRPGRGHPGHLPVRDGRHLRRWHHGRLVGLHSRPLRRAPTRDRR